VHAFSEALFTTVADRNRRYGKWLCDRNLQSWSIPRERPRVAAVVTTSAKMRIPAKKECPPGVANLDWNKWRECVDRIGDAAGHGHLKAFAGNPEGLS
jgi:hypothetical protein